MLRMLKTLHISHDLVKTRENVFSAHNAAKQMGMLSFVKRLSFYTKPQVQFQHNHLFTDFNQSCGFR